MKKIEFTKMHGIGNDYIYIDCFKQEVDDPARLARIMSPRRTSVGSDGVILICPSDVADAKMRMFNLDGSEGKMCGNGIRCVGKYIYDTGIAHKDTLTVETLSGIKTLKVTAENGKAVSLTVDMGEPILNPKDIPVIFDGDRMINELVDVKALIRDADNSPYSLEDILAEYGTGVLVNILHEAGGLPTANFTVGQFDKHEGVSGETMSPMICGSARGR